MKITIDAQAKDVQVLAKAGLLKGAKVLQRTPAKRRQLSKKTETVLRARLDMLRAYRDRFGSFEVPRTGIYAELGDWLDKLRETYVKAPDGYRIRYLREHAIDVLGYLADWARRKVSRMTVRSAPFWLSASWVAEFMETKLNAPSQASIHPDEVAMAKWLSRWTSQASMDRLKRDASAYYVAQELDDLAQMLRSRDRQEVDEARERIRTWRLSPMYGRIVKMCAEDEEWMTKKRRRALDERMMGSSFWPTWSEWKRDASVWVKKGSDKESRA